MKKTMTAAEAIVEVLRREGVEKAFCVPGESYLSVIDALYDSGIELISGRQEGGVAFMAEGYAKASGNVGVCLATRGPGATNLSIGLHTAYQDSTPLVAFIGQVPSSFRQREGFQEIDLDRFFSHICKWAVELREPERVPELVHRAFHVARTGRPGPVVISLPVDILDQSAEMVFQEATIFAKPRPTEEAVMEAKRLLERAKRPVIVAGGGVTQTRCVRKLVALAEKLHSPVVTAFRRFDAFPNDHKNYVGSLGLATPAYLLEAVKGADVVLALGTRFSQVTTQDYTLFDETTTLIHVDISEAELNKVYRPTIGIVSDVERFIDDLLRELHSYQPSVDASYVETLRAAYETFATPKRKNGESYVDLEGIMYDINELAPRDAIFTSDAGNFYGWMYRFLSFHGERRYIGPTSGAMGYGLPSAIGAKLAYPDRPVIAFSGDGGAMMTIQELETAARYDIPIVFIIANNNMYGTIRMHQERIFPNRVIATDLSNPNFVEFMKSLGGDGETITDNEAFASVFACALRSERPFVIELLTDRERITVTSTIADLRKSANAR